MALSIEQLESWEKEAGIHFDKLEEVDEMIHRKLVDRNLAKRMGTVADDNIQILISKLRDSLEDSDISEVCNVLDQIKSKESDNDIKNRLQVTSIKTAMTPIILSLSPLLRRLIQLRPKRLHTK